MIKLKDILSESTNIELNKIITDKDQPPFMTEEQWQKKWAKDTTLNELFYDEIAKKYIALGFEVSLSENYGEHLGFKDKEYKELGVKISKDDKEIINSADVILLGVSRTSKTPTSIYLEIGRAHV